MRLGRLGQHFWAVLMGRKGQPSVGPGPHPWGHETPSCAWDLCSTHRNGLHYKPVVESHRLWQPLCFSVCLRFCTLPPDLQNCLNLPARHKFNPLCLSLRSEALPVPISRPTLLFSLLRTSQISPSSQEGLKQALNLGSRDQDAWPGSATYQGKVHITPFPQNNGSKTR